jgi:hypothetical protein
MHVCSRSSSPAPRPSRFGRNYSFGQSYDNITYIAKLDEADDPEGKPSANVAADCRIRPPNPVSATGLRPTPLPFNRRRIIMAAALDFERVRDD